MKHHGPLILIAIFAIIILAGCTLSLDETHREKFSAPLIQAFMSDFDAGTKTSYLFNESSGEGLVYWSIGDKINVFFDSKSIGYTSQQTNAQESTVTFKSDSTLTREQLFASRIWGLYPYNSSAQCDGSRITTVLPWNQQGAEGTFSDGTSIAIACSYSCNNLYFSNACAGIKFSLSRNDVKSIVFKGHGEPLAGSVEISMVDDVPSLYCNPSGAVDSVMLTPKKGSTFKKDVNYFIMTFPAALSSGFVVKFDTGEQTGLLSYDHPLYLERNVIRVKKDLDSYAKFADKYHPVTGVILDKETATLKINEQIILVASVLPDNATNKALSWTSSDTSVASVNGGVVMANNGGRCTISVTTIDGNYHAECLITVKGDGLDPGIGDWGQGGDYGGVTE